MDTGLLTMPKPVELQVRKTEVTPDPELEKRTRRTFTAEYKLRIIAEAAQCRHGELGALLRRENFYSNQLQDWRRQLAAGGEQALSKTAPGPRSGSGRSKSSAARMRDWRGGLISPTGGLLRSCLSWHIGRTRDCWTPE
jgi:transposase-like protein